MKKKINLYVVYRILFLKKIMNMTGYLFQSQFELVSVS